MRYEVQGIGFTTADSIRDESQDVYVVTTEQLIHAVAYVALHQLPDQYRVLPDGRATHSVLARAVAEKLDGHRAQV